MLAPEVPISLDDPRVAPALAKLEANASSRHSLRALAKISIDGPRGSGRANQVVLAKRPALLRIEVFGLMNQIASLLVTDGQQFTVYDASRRTFERGTVHEQLLRATTGVDLSPQEAVQLLLASPALPANYRVEAVVELHGGGFAIVLHDPALEAKQDFGDAASWRRFEFDSALRLVRASVIAKSGEPIWEAAFLDFAPLTAEAAVSSQPAPSAESAAHAEPATAAPAAMTDFPRRIELRVPHDAIFVVLQFSVLELNSELDENLFTL